MRIPRDVGGVELAKRLSKFGYKVQRQQGSHMRLTTHQNGEHHITIPAHSPLRLGTLSAILNEVAGHHGISKQALISELFA